MEERGRKGAAQQGWSGGWVTTTLKAWFMKGPVLRVGDPLGAGGGAGERAHWVCSKLPGAGKV